MTKAQKREGAHNSAAIPPEQASPWGASVEGGGEKLSESEALAPVQPRAPPERMLRFADVIRATGLSRTTIWRLEKRGQFPKKVKLSPNRKGRSEREVRRWMRERMEAAA